MEEITVQTSDNFKLSARKIKTIEIEAFEMSINIYKDRTSMVISRENALELGKWLVMQADK